MTHKLISSLLLKLPFAVCTKRYLIKDDDSEKEMVLEGAELAKGVTLTLEEPKTSLLWHISPVE